MTDITENQLCFRTHTRAVFYPRNTSVYQPALQINSINLFLTSALDSHTRIHQDRVPLHMK